MINYPQNLKGEHRIDFTEEKIGENKKEYVIELENTVDKLEQEIVRLNNMVDKYRFKIGVHVIGEEKDFGEYNELQELKMK